VEKKINTIRYNDMGRDHVTNW